ncbi:MAG: hypothetical protein Q8T13_23565 [Acidobacteriota bacterium]|nr:hypothetical protein [Acidobacteriota bacterium]
MSSRGNAPSLAISGIPPEVLERFMTRARRDGWFSKNALLIELMRDYGNETLTPAAAPPPFDPTRKPGSSGQK